MAEHKGIVQTVQWLGSPPSSPPHHAQLRLSKIVFFCAGHHASATERVRHGIAVRGAQAYAALRRGASAPTRRHAPTTAGSKPPFESVASCCGCPCKYFFQGYLLLLAMVTLHHAPQPRECRLASCVMGQWLPALTPRPNSPDCTDDDTKHKSMVFVLIRSRTERISEARLIRFHRFCRDCKQSVISLLFSPVMQYNGVPPSARVNTQPAKHGRPCAWWFPAVTQLTCG